MVPRSGAPLWVAAAALVACWVTLSVLPAFANGSDEAQNRRIDAAWAMFADDLSSATGIPVRYLPPSALGARGEDRASGHHGGIGSLRIGAHEGPAVIVLPEDLVENDSVSMAFEDSGLQQPRLFTQGLATTVMRLRNEGAASGTLTLADQLKTSAIVLPVHVRTAEGHDRSQKGRGSSSHVPTRNFPARWDEAATVAPTRAGPYPASHPRVRALTAWLHGSLDAVQLFVVGEDAAARLADHAAPAGSLEAFASEEAGIPVQGVSGADLLGRAGEVLARVPSLRFDEPVWTRLGTSNWVLDVSLASLGPGQGEATETGQGRGGSQILIGASVPGSQLQLTAVAAGENLELLPLSSNGIPLRFIEPGAERRLRFFFSDPESALEGSRSSRSAAMPGVTLNARAAKVVDATLRAAPPADSKR